VVSTVDMSGALIADTALQQLLLERMPAWT
jgi:hypothetical protein